MASAAKLVLRITKYLAIAIFTVVVVLAAYLHIERSIFRHRAEHLLAEYHSIHLLHSDWQQASSIITRWRAYGRADGSCSASDCGYLISLYEPSDHFIGSLKPWRYAWLYDHGFFRIYNLLGGRSPGVSLSFIVEDGKIVRDSFYFHIQKPSQYKDYPGIWTMSFSARSMSTLFADRISLLSDGGADGHPDYSVGRPTSCKINCEMEWFRYTPYLSQSEIDEHTRVGLDCITRWTSCKNISDIAPGLSAWNLYTDAETWGSVQPAGKTCTMPVRALARDAAMVFDVDVLTNPVISPTEGRPSSNKVLVASAKIVRILKGDGPYEAGRQIVLNAVVNPVVYVTPPVMAHRRYLLFMDSYFAVPDPNSVLYMGACSAIPESDAVLREAEEGILESKPLRRSEQFQFPNESSVLTDRR
ncbi:MAG: hypothetical protein ABI142_00335 [Bryocella sp.]